MPDDLSDPALDGHGGDSALLTACWGTEQRQYLSRRDNQDLGVTL
ncbi:hypothetical protein SUDANB58_05842 (plasmid) [Streptomyces sp. enrichment culture]